MAVLAKDKQDVPPHTNHCAPPQKQKAQKKKKNQWFIVKNRKEYGNMIHRRQFTNGFQECL